MSIKVAPQITNLAYALQEIPGIGPKSAQRIALYLLNRDEQYVNQLIQALDDLRTGVQRCRCCNTFTEGDLCSVCADTSRNAKMLCVVESVADQMAIESSLSWSGYYFVLNGRINPIDGIGPYEIGFDALLERIEKSIDELKEVVIATSYTPDGDTTAFFLIENLKKRWPDLRVTRLARGLPSGVEIEYTDLNSIANAIYDRNDV